jgi:acetate kinase
VRVLAVNAGSSSLKLSVVDDADTVVASSHSDGTADAEDALRSFAATVGTVDAVAHRIVHGGPAIRNAALVDAEVRRHLEAAAALAPLHDPPALRLLDAARGILPVPQVACVDTAFHSTIPQSATTYAVPRRWRDLGVRRYGFHGLSYAWATQRAAEILGRHPGTLRLLLTHIGSGVSACAVRLGRSVDTSMGFTPLEGAVMATRSGSVDPGALLWLQQVHGVGAAGMNRALEQESGLLALGGSADVRDVETAAATGDRAAAAALDVYIHSLSRNLAAVAASLDRVDALVFTGGVGEHSTVVRGRVCAHLGVLGVPTPEPRDPSTVADSVIAEPVAGGRTSVLVVTAREDAQMAREARRVLRSQSG